MSRVPPGIWQTLFNLEGHTDRDGNKGALLVVREDPRILHFGNDGDTTSDIDAGTKAGRPFAAL
jgi:hypothetical protein